jgi:hypothetical protein
MAFNPFHTFRKYQKVLLAILAIFCMFVFVLQFGRGDPIERLMSYFGAGRSGFRQGQLVTTLHDKKVYEGDLSQVQFRRDLATGFLIYAANEGGVKKVLDMAGELPKEGPLPTDQLGQMVAKWAGLLTSQQRQAAFLVPIYAEQDLPVLLRMAAEAADKPDQQDKARNAVELARGIQVQGWLYSRRDSKEFYFGGGPKTSDLLDFLVWRDVADRLGITLTEDQVIHAVNYEAAGQKVVTASSLEGDAVVANYLRQHGGNRRGQVQASELLKALTDEFRVGMAQDAVLNQKGGVRAPLQAFPGFGSAAADPLHEVPAALTPREFLDAFRRARTTLRVAMLPVRVKDFVDRVEGTPPESTLRQLFNDFKAVEPAPDRDKPAFKEPRRVQVEYLTAKPNIPYYAELAKTTLLFEGGVARLLPPAGIGGIGGGVLPALTAAAGATYDPVRQEYEYNYEPQARDLVRQAYGVGIDPPARKAVAAAAAVGAAVGADGRVAALAALAAGAQVEAVNAAKAEAGLLAAGTVPTPFAGLAMPFVYTYAVQPLEAVRDRLQVKEEEKLAPRLLARNLDKVAEELSRLRSRPEEARAYIEKAAKEYHLDRHAMAEPKDRYELPDDPALKPLADAVAAADKKPFDAAEAGQLFLGNVGVYDARKYPTVGFDSAKEPFLYWRTKDLAARERTFEEARPLVLQAWKLEQARPLAWKDAMRIKAAVKDNAAQNRSPAEVARVLREHGKTFELDNVANLLPVDQPQASSARIFRPYTPPVDLIPYPPGDFVDQLLTMEKPGDATVIRDRPATTFFVAALLDRNDPTRSTQGGVSVVDLKEFRDLYQEASLPSSRTNSLWSQEVDRRRREYRERVIKELRAAATGGKVDKDGNFILPEGVSRNEAQTDTGE